MSNMQPKSKPVVGILYAGDMGAAVGRLWAADGFRVLTTVASRSTATTRRARDAGLEIVDSVADVASVADIVVSLVPPARACSVAEEFCANVPAAARATYIDANSIAPETARQIAGLFAATNFDFVDGAIVGLAGQLRQRGIFFLSGPAADRCAVRLTGSLRMRVVGSEIGQASALKSLQAGMSKGLIALFLELTSYARELNLGDAAIEFYREFYPAIMELIDRLLPTYPRHARRRGQEMEELENALLVAGLEPNMVHGARRIIEAMAELHLDRQNRDWKTSEVIETTHQLGMLCSLKGPVSLENPGLASCTKEETPW